ncbi:MAG: OmpA family protein [Bacteroidota bacterium]
MKTPLTRLSILTLLIFALFTACKPKKMVTQAAPVPVAAAPVQETPRPAPVPESDSDKDGIPDSKDNCPSKAGSAQNNGCPEVAAAAPSFNYKNILFEFNSSVLKTSSYSTLDEIAKEMKKYPDMKFSLNGHSSAEGTETRNMTLSIDRATAVKSYLVSAGINGRNLEAKGFGESMPLNTNNTEAARQQNRRVEIKKDN